MPAGLQIFDAQGAVVLDTTDYIFKIFGTAETGIEDGSVFDALITEKTVVIVLGLDPSNLDVFTDVRGFLGVRQPRFEVSDGVIKWTFGTFENYYLPEKGRLNARFLYGEYR